MTRDILRTVKSIGEMVGMGKEKGKTDGSGIDWPCLDYESPSASPILSPKRSDADSDETLLIHSTHSTHSEIHSAESSGINISRCPSDVDFGSISMVYRLFVEKSLKRRGMLPVLYRIARMLGPALYKARMALSIACPKYSDVTKSGLFVPAYRQRVHILSVVIDNNGLNMFMLLDWS